MKPEILTEEENAFLLDGTCPDCRARLLMDGPSAGITKNVLCGECRTEFNFSFVKSWRIGQPCDPTRQFEFYGISSEFRPVKSYGSLEPLTRAELDTGLHAGCDNPACDCHNQPIDELFLKSRCHPMANVKASYVKGGMVLIRCAACEKLIIKIAVAP